MLKYVGIAVFALYGTACNVGCTLIGCDSGLTLQLTTQSTAPFHIEATSPNGGSRSYDCADSAGCRSTIGLSDYLPETVMLTVTYQGRTTTSTVRPQYSESNPNGKHCGPTCRRATVMLSLP